MILIIDNYDSFTYNLVQLVAAVSDDYTVARNDALTVEEVASTRPSGILISPGPGRPENAGICVELIRRCGPEIPILGVCLGHQAIGVAFGAVVSHARRLMHGKPSFISHDGESIYRGLPNPFEATRYHSLAIEEDSLPPVLTITSKADDGTIMGVRHTGHPIEGVQFHPESILTTAGPDLVRNWLRHILETA